MLFRTLRDIFNKLFKKKEKHEAIRFVAPSTHTTMTLRALFCAEDTPIPSVSYWLSVFPDAVVTGINPKGEIVVSAMILPIEGNTLRDICKGDLCELDIMDNVETYIIRPNLVKNAYFYVGMIKVRADMQGSPALGLLVNRILEVIAGSTTPEQNVFAVTIPENVESENAAIRAGLIRSPEHGVIGNHPYMGRLFVGMARKKS